jgi:hypothetical protein
LKCSAFYEPDVGNALTAIAIVPSPEVRKVCSSLPLAGKYVDPNADKWLKNVLNNEKELL